MNDATKFHSQCGESKLGIVKGWATDAASYTGLETIVDGGGGCELSPTCYVNAFRAISLNMRRSKHEDLSECEAMLETECYCLFYGTLFRDLPGIHGQNFTQHANCTVLCN